MRPELRRAASALSQKLLRPCCRAWAQHVLKDRPADPIYELLGALVFWEVHRYWPHFRRPQTFSEKVWHRCLYDRDPKWTLFSDKLRTRDYVAERLGSEYLPSLLWTGTDPDAIPFDDLPPRFAIKTNHGCGYNILVLDKSRIDRAAVRAQVAGWLGENFCESNVVGMEWGYKHVSPKILIEEMLGRGDTLPADYKFYCYAGRARFIQVDVGRYRDHRRAFFDCEFNRLPATFSKRLPTEGPFTRPGNLPEMVRAAERLAGDEPFIRVDLYSIDGRLYAGELTAYPGGGMLRWVPRSWDDVFGAEWRVPSAP